MPAVVLGTAHATSYSTNWNAGFANSVVVPDNNLSGWNGDLYASLRA